MEASDVCVEFDSSYAVVRHLNCLQDQNRATRRRALEAVRNEVFPGQTNNAGDRLAPEPRLVELIIGPLLRAFSDPVEKCRELAIMTVTEVFELTREPCSLLPCVVPTLVQRLAQPEIVETSEELRLNLVQLMHSAVDRSNIHVASYLHDLVRVLQRTIVDPFPEVKKWSCATTSLLARTVAQQFHTESQTLIAPLLTIISHQHSKVRVAAVTCIGDVVLYGSGKSVDDVVSHLAQRLFDASPAVRAAVTQVVGSWLLDLCDRYSFHHKLIPLLLTGTTDDMPDIRRQADALWHDVGLKYAGENESDIKDKMDFAENDRRCHFPPGVERCNLGCRTLVYHNFSKILSGVVADLADWVVSTRVKAAQLLYTLLLNEEDNVTQHVDKVLTAACKACTDDEPAVVDHVVRCVELVGYFVSADIWCALVLERVNTSQSPASLSVLAAVIRGSESAQLRAHLDDISAVLTHPGICHVAERHVQQQVLACVSAIIQVSQEQSTTISRQLFTVIISVIALHRTDDITDTARQVLGRLAAVVGCVDGAELFDRHTVDVLMSMDNTYQTWTQHSAERLIFDALLLEAGAAVGRLLPNIMPILRANLQPDKDAEVRSKFFTLLSQLIVNADTTLNSDNRLGEFAVMIVRDMILPNCVWRAGRTAAALRKAAVACLWTVVSTRLLTTDQLSDVFADVLSELQSTLDDDLSDTRLLSCRTLRQLLTAVNHSDVTQDRLHAVYPCLLKRLDDACDHVRVAASHTFAAYMRCFHDNYDVSLYRAHLRAIYDGLLVHLDDQDSSVQRSILETLEASSHVAPDMLLKAVDEVKHKHRSSSFCDELINYVHALPKPSD